MSRRLLLTAAVVALFYCSFGQNASPYWSLSGNTNASASSKLGTTNGAPLRLFTKNVERFRIDSLGKVAIGTTFPKGKLTLFNNGSTPAASWITTANPLFTGFGEATGGNGDFFLAMASNTTTTRPNIIGRRARGTLAAPLAVANNDFITSFQASGYDGSAFQNAANVDFFVDGTPTKGNVPVRISFTTGSNLNNRKERLKIGNTGNFNFNNNQMYIRASDGFIGMGTAAPRYKLHVTNDSTDGTIFAENYYSGYYEGVAVRATADNGTGHGVGVWARGGHLGVMGWGENDSVDARTSGAQGLSGVARGVGFRIVGVQGDAIDTKAGGFGNAYGVFGMAGGDGFVAAGYFQGDVYANNYFYISDRKFKASIKPMENGLAGIMKLKPTTYEFKTEEYKGMNLPKGRHLGLIAQELKEVFPELVREAVQPAHRDYITQKEISPEVRYEAVNYQGLIPVLIASIQEQEKKIEKQEQENIELKNELADLKAIVNKLVQGGNAVSLNNASLGLANPNPANNIAIVTYNIPPASRAAHIIVTDIKGSTIKRINLSGNSSGQVKINTGALAAGAYTYSLVVDGSKADSKQLLIAR